VANPDRLSSLDASFLHLENAASHMHIAACAVFAGPPPGYDEVLGTVSDRLHLIPRYRQRLAFVPLATGRPVWVDDPHFQITYHVRHTALPRPGGDLELRRLAGRVVSQALDRARPLWELWLVEGLVGGRFAALSKTHHALVDGISGVDIATVLFDSSRHPAPLEPPAAQWAARPLPSSSQLLADALLEHATAPAEIARALCAAIHTPRRVAGRLAATIVGLESLTSTSARPAPATPFNVPIGPHRRVAWVRTELAALRAVSRRQDATVNDVVLTVVAGALGRYMRGRGIDTDGEVLRVMVPVSVRSVDQRGALGNRVSAIWVPLPVGLRDPLRRLREIGAATAAIKRSGQALSAEVLTGLAGFAPTTIMAQAARLQARQRLFNLVVTNVPGPQRPLYLLGRELQAVYPMAPLAQNTALGVAIVSYNGRVSFGLTADFDALRDLESVAEAIRRSIDELPTPGPNGSRSAARAARAHAAVEAATRTRPGPRPSSA
jgi:WS/DGAT/MGAT family acyltransferase